MQHATKEKVFKNKSGLVFKFPIAWYFSSDWHFYLSLYFDFY